jgi:predicted enzyme related to lactoylglutathione lyase
MTQAKSTGKFVWHEILSTNTKASVKFYTELFGWTTAEMDMGPMGTYTLFKRGEDQVGGCMQAQGGAPTHWLAYAMVESVDGAAEKAKSLGATVLVPPMEVPNIGRWTVLRDPQGAVLAAFTAPANSPAPKDENKRGPGEFCWDELMTQDTDAAVKFYSAIWGWTMKAPKADDPHGYWHVQREGNIDCGGMMKSPPDMPSAWLSYIGVANVDTAFAKAQGLGAKPVVEPRDIPGTGRFAVLTDPTGGVFAIYKGAH